jgi:hypothetical protein
LIGKLIVKNAISPNNKTLPAMKCSSVGKLKPLKLIKTPHVIIAIKLNGNRQTALPPVYRPNTTPVSRTPKPLSSSNILCVDLIFKAIFFEKSCVGFGYIEFGHHFRINLEWAINPTVSLNNASIKV